MKPPVALSRRTAFFMDPRRSSGNETWDSRVIHPIERSLCGEWRFFEVLDRRKPLGSDGQAATAVRVSATANELLDSAECHDDDRRFRELSSGFTGLAQV